MVDSARGKADNEGLCKTPDEFGCVKTIHPKT